MCYVIPAFTGTLLLAVAKVGFEDQTYTIQEGVDMEVCVTFDKKLEKYLSIEYFLNNISPFGENGFLQQSLDIVSTAC